MHGALQYTPMTPTENKTACESTNLGIIECTDLDEKSGFVIITSYKKPNPIMDTNNTKNCSRIRNLFLTIHIKITSMLRKSQHINSGIPTNSKLSAITVPKYSARSVAAAAASALTNTGLSKSFCSIFL